MKKFLYTIIGLLSCTFATVSCFDESVTQESYYTFTGEMVTDYLNNREEKTPGTFSDFINVLHRAELYDLLSTYGTFTCFAPTNDAIQIFLKSRGYASVDDMPKAECDTLAWTHILKETKFTTDGIGTWDCQNLNHRMLTVMCDEYEGRVRYSVEKKNVEIIQRDDSVVNGVVHVIDHVISSSPVLLGQKICEDPKATIFSHALKVTGWADYMDTHMEDPFYTISEDSTKAYYNQAHYFGGHEVYERFPEKRYFMYSVFVEPDSILELRKGIKDFESLCSYAKQIYDVTYPKDASAYEADDYTNPKHPLNRYVAYHILDRMTTENNITVDKDGEVNSRNNFLTDSLDIMEFYETCLSRTILKVTDIKNKLYINRMMSSSLPGARIFSQTEATSFYPPSSPDAEDGYHATYTNGVYYYVDNLITYDRPNTIEKALNCRFRMDATTLSPDFQTSGARNIKLNSTDKQNGANYIMMGFKPGFVKNFEYGDDTFFGVHMREICFSYENDMCACLGNFNIKFKLPPVPAGLTYEVRLGCNSGNGRTVVQVYFSKDNEEIPCGTPIDLRKYATEYGWVADSEQSAAEILEKDKALRNQNVMKAMDSFLGADGKPMRNDGNNMCLRHILTTKYFEEGHDYYVRLRQVLDNGAEMSLDYIEIVPKSIYNGSVPEDRH